MKHLYIILFVLPLIGFGQTEYIKEYHTNGKIKVEGNLVNGEKDGVWNWYHENGQLQEESYHEWDIQNMSSPLWYKTYYSNGNLEQEGTVIIINSNNDDFIDTGLQNRYHENGQLYWSGSYKDGYREGLWKYYYQNGQLQSEENLYNDSEKNIYECPYGVQREWNENGQLENEENWVLHPDDGCTPHGSQRSWYKGQLIMEENYNNGVLISKECWELDGTKMICE